MEGYSCFQNCLHCKLTIHWPDENSKLKCEPVVIVLWVTAFCWSSTGCFDCQQVCDIVHVLNSACFQDGVSCLIAAMFIPCNRRTGVYAGWGKNGQFFCPTWLIVVWFCALSNCNSSFTDAYRTERRAQNVLNDLLKRWSSNIIFLYNVPFLSSIHLSTSRELELAFTDLTRLQFTNCIQLTAPT